METLFLNKVSEEDITSVVADFRGDLYLDTGKTSAVLLHEFFMINAIGLHVSIQSVSR